MVNKSELIERVAADIDKTKKEVGLMVDSVLKVVANALENGEKVTLIGFGNFLVRDRKERMGRNPRDGQPMKISASKIPTFKAGKSLKELVNSK